MTLLNDSLAELVRRKVIEPREAFAKAVDKASITGMLNALGYELS
jgi:hypothetical protein